MKLNFVVLGSPNFAVHFEVQFSIATWPVFGFIWTGAINRMKEKVKVVD
jgi:hypothetical protein